MVTTKLKEAVLAIAILINITQLILAAMTRCLVKDYYCQTVIQDLN